jgi:hypothetical protein
VWQNNRNTQKRIDSENLNNLAREVCNDLQNNFYGRKLLALKPGHNSLWSFTKIFKNKTRGVPAWMDLLS